MQSNKRDGPKASERAIERASALCVTFANLAWSKNVVKTRRYEPGSRRSFLSVASSAVRDIRAPQCTASSPNAAFGNFVLHLPICFAASSTNLLLFKKQSKQEKKKYNNFHVNNFLSYLHFSP